MDTLKNRVRFSTTLPKETNDKLKKFSEKTMIPISKIVEASIEFYIKEKSNPG